jgi:hypothetical protein
MTANKKFSQFTNGGAQQSGDQVVGLRSGANTIFTSEADNITALQSDVSDLDEAIANVNDEIGSLNASVMGLGTTLSDVQTDLNTPQAGKTYLATNGALGTEGTETYPFLSLAQAIDTITPSQSVPDVTIIAPGTYSEGGPIALAPYTSLQGEEGSSPIISIDSGGTQLTLNSDWSGNSGDAALVNCILPGGFNFDSQTSAGGTIKIKNVDIQNAFCELLGSGSSTSFYEIEGFKSTSGMTAFAGNFKIRNSSYGVGLDIQGKSTGTTAYIDGLIDTDLVEFTGVDGPCIVTMINSPNLGSPIYINNTQVTLSVDNLTASNRFVFNDGATIDQIVFLDQVREPYDVIEISGDGIIYDAHFGRFINFNSPVPITITLPDQATVPTQVGTFLKGANIGAGLVTFVTMGADSSSGNTDMIMATGTSVEIIRNYDTNWEINGGSAFFIGKLSQVIAAFANSTYSLEPYMPVAGTFANMVSKCQSGTANATFDINGTPLGSDPNAVSNSRDIQGAGAPCTFALGDEINVTGDTAVACLYANLGGSFFYMGNY